MTAASRLNARATPEPGAGQSMLPVDIFKLLLRTCTARQSYLVWYHLRCSSALAPFAMYETRQPTPLFAKGLAQVLNKTQSTSGLAFLTWYGIPYIYIILLVWYHYTMLSQGLLLCYNIYHAAGTVLATLLLTGGALSRSRSTADQKARKPVTGRRVSPSLSYKPHTAHHSLGTFVISAGLVYGRLLPPRRLSVWRASQSEGT